MFRNYLKTSVRNLARRKMYAGINIFGLSFGIVSCFLISLYVYDELSYDTFFEDGDRIYRIALERVYPDHTRFFASSSVMVAPTVSENYPEVEAATRLHRLFFSPTVVVNIDDRSFEEKAYLFADSNFFNVFPMTFLEGSPQTALDTDDKVVLTDATARRYFGEESALGKTFSMGETDHVVSAVVRDLPENSHMNFDLLGSIQDIEYLQSSIDNNNWVAMWLYTYVKLREGVSPESFEAKLPSMVDDFAVSSLISDLNIPNGNWADSGHQFNYFLQPLYDIHLKSALDVELQPNGNITYVYLLSSIVVFILLISCINFVNLETARSPERAKEIGIRKALGSFRSNLIAQFLSEAVIISLLSMVVSLGLAWLFLPVFNDLVEKQLGLDLLFSPQVVLGLIAFALLVGVLAGGYPALVLSRLNPAVVLKGSFKSSSRGLWLRNSLVFIQYVISIGLISGTIVIRSQMAFLSDQKLGYDTENVLLIKQARALEGVETFKAAILELPDVESVGGADRMPGEFFGSNIFIPDEPDLAQLRANVMRVDDDYLDVMAMRITDGRNFLPEYADSASIIINRSAAETLGYTNPVGRIIFPAGDESELLIVGLVDDFNFESLHHRVFPMVIFRGGENFSPATLAIRLNSGSTSDAVATISSIWREHVPEQEMIYSFFETDLDRQYQSEQVAFKIFNGFSILAILLACVGLFGMAAFTANQRTSEIGIRKILGASTPNIVQLLTGEFIYLILAATLVAGLLSHMAMSSWLETFAYHIEPGITAYAMAGGIALALAWLTTSYQSIKSARMNPVDSLRSE